MTFKGNKSFLAQKTCRSCGRVFTWRKKWARNWEDVVYCSAACRKKKGNNPPEKKGNP
ncbi:MAG: DUF2256 domain-containing protein [Chitinophagaceae bacterium]